MGASFGMSERTGEAIGFSSTIICCVSLGFCSFVLLAAAWVYSVPTARHTIDRISFRMMCLSMVFGTAYDLCYILLEPELHAVNPRSTGCKIVMYWQTATMGAVNYFITCIAVNLMLSICFALNTIHLRLERWYIGVSLFVAFVVPMAPAALGHFGYDPVYESCYFTSPSLQRRLMYFVLDLYLWQAASTLIACVSVVAVLFTLVRSGRATVRALLWKDTSSPQRSQAQQARQSQDASSQLSNQSSTQSSTPCKLKTLFTRQDPAQFRLKDQFLSVAFRISLYPILMVIMNTVLIVGDMYLSAHEVVDSKTVYGLYIVYYVLYGGRNLFLAITGICADPGLSRGLRLAWRASRKTRSADEQYPSLEEGDLDLVSALASVTYVAADKPKRRLKFWTRSVLSDYDEKTTARQQITTSFNGVAPESLPVGMTDEVDVDLTIQTGWAGDLSDSHESVYDHVKEKAEDAAESGDSADETGISLEEEAQRHFQAFLHRL